MAKEVLKMPEKMQKEELRELTILYGTTQAKIMVSAALYSDLQAALKENDLAKQKDILGDMIRSRDVSKWISDNSASVDDFVYALVKAAENGKNEVDLRESHAIVLNTKISLQSREQFESDFLNISNSILTLKRRDKILNRDEIFTDPAEEARYKDELFEKYTPNNYLEFRDKNWKKYKWKRYSEDKVAEQMIKKIKKVVPAEQQPEYIRIVEEARAEGLWCLLGVMDRFIDVMAKDSKKFDASDVLMVASSIRRAFIIPTYASEWFWFAGVSNAPSISAEIGKTGVKRTAAGLGMTPREDRIMLSAKLSLNSLLFQYDFVELTKGAKFSPDNFYFSYGGALGFGMMGAGNSVVLLGPASIPMKTGSASFNMPPSFLAIMATINLVQSMPAIATTVEHPSHLVSATVAQALQPLISVSKLNDLLSLLGLIVPQNMLGKTTVNLSEWREKINEIDSLIGSRNYNAALMEIKKLMQYTEKSLVASQIFKRYLMAIEDRAIEQELVHFGGEALLTSPTKVLEARMDEAMLALNKLVTRCRNGERLDRQETEEYLGLMIYFASKFMIGRNSKGIYSVPPSFTTPEKQMELAQLFYRGATYLIGVISQGLGVVSEEQLNYARAVLAEAGRMINVQGAANYYGYLFHGEKGFSPEVFAYFLDFGAKLLVSVERFSTVALEEEAHARAVIEKTHPVFKKAKEYAAAVKSVPYGKEPMELYGYTREPVKERALDEPFKKFLKTGDISYLTNISDRLVLYRAFIWAVVKKNGDKEYLTKLQKVMKEYPGLVENEMKVLAIVMKYTAGKTYSALDAISGVKFFDKDLFSDLTKVNEMLPKNKATVPQVMKDDSASSVNKSIEGVNAVSNEIEKLSAALKKEKEPQKRQKLLFDIRTRLIEYGEKVGQLYSDVERMRRKVFELELFVKYSEDLKMDEKSRKSLNNKIADVKGVVEGIVKSLVNENDTVTTAKELVQRLLDLNMTQAQYANFFRPVSNGEGI